MFDSVLVANRGEIARRVIKSVQASGRRAVAVYSEADVALPFVEEADEAVCLGGAAPKDSYLDVQKILAAAAIADAGAVHPGYGFLSENADFAQSVLDAGLVWIGPDPSVIRSMGNKINARNLMQGAGVPVFAGTEDSVETVEAAAVAAEQIGYPVMIKAAAGGGGIGMQVVRGPSELGGALEIAQSGALRSFGSAEVFLERYVDSARHIEVQVLGLADGKVICLGERDCSVQRRHQKVIEEAPAAMLLPEQRSRLHQAAVVAAESVGYRGAGTVEFLYDVDRGEFSFLEMNTRLQVEHPVTELVTGVDLVDAQLRVAAGETIDLPPRVEGTGHAIELRIYAEDSERFFPSPGTITAWREPVGEGIRIDAGYREGNVVTPHYDPLLAKLCVWGKTRHEAIARTRQAAVDFVIEGPRTNLDFLREVLATDEFVEDTHDTGLAARLRPSKKKE